MPGFFSRLKGKDGPSKVKKGVQQTAYNEPPPKPRWEDAWTRKSVDADEVQELLRGCTTELKSRGLDMPFLLLPFRPTSDPSAARTFVRHFFNQGQQPLRGEALAQELRLTEPMVLCSVVKWCWSRLPGGVVGWEAYELFKVGESDSNMARDSFRTFIPLSVDSDARTKIIFDFFDLLSGIAAHAKTNGLGGRKLSRLAGWWAFEQLEDGSGFDGGYKNWAAAADATSHLFFAYLRSQSPDSVKGLNGISTLPISLQKLVEDTEYPPQRLKTLQTRTTKVVMIVDSVSPTPFALLRRANHFQYRDDDRALQEFAEYEDPVKALTDECRRVLRSISTANQTQVSTSKDSTGLSDASWSRFEDIGFSGALQEADEDDETSFVKKSKPQQLRRTPAARANATGRPTTPSWADFLSAGFVDEAGNNPAPLLLPPDKILPPINTRGQSSQSHRPMEGHRLEPGELASIARFELDDVFWWVWISSLAGEEFAERKATFGRCALIETTIPGGRWLVMEEIVKGAAAPAEEGAYIAEKKSFWGRSKKNKGPTRRKSTAQHAQSMSLSNLNQPKYSVNHSQHTSKLSIGPDQHARIQAAAAQLQERQRVQEAQQESTRRGRNEVDATSMKTNSVMTLGTVIMNEASPAMKWANKYDKDAIRAAYLANSNHARGLEEASNQANGSQKGPETPRPAPATRGNTNERDLPTVPSTAKPVVPEKVATPLPVASPAPFPPTPAKDDFTNERVHLSEKAAEVALPQDSHPVERKPVGSAPAMPSQPVLQVRPSMDQYGTSPDYQSPKANKLKKREASTSGFKKIFGRKNRQSKVPENYPPQVTNGREAVEKTGGSGLGRRLSQLGRKKTPPVDQYAVTAPTAGANGISAPSSRPASVVPSVTPVVSPNNHDFERSYDPSIQDTLSRVDTNDAHEARQAFSSFDQGPLEDVPAFVPDESPRRPSFAESEPEHQPPAKHAAEVEVPPPALQHEQAKENISDLSRATPPASPASPAPVVQDRWAQIRKNAAERAAQRQAEEQTSGKSLKTEAEDGETSGEETIESRVARIKARVAELTGNMEGNGNATAVTNGPPKRRA